MNRVVINGTRTGQLVIPASKSAAHRQLICAAFSDGPVSVICDGLSDDINATAECLRAFGASVTDEGNHILKIVPVNLREIKSPCQLYCKESGSTLRFLMPVVGALGCDAVFHMEGRLPERPHDALISELERHGMTIRKEGSKMVLSGKLSGGIYRIPGNISSQFVSGLLFALPLLDEPAVLEVTGPVESSAYIDMTENALRAFGVAYEKNGQIYRFDGRSSYRNPGDRVVERDWSNAAFFLSIGALSKKGVTIDDMDLNSPQGDKKILDVLKNFGADIKIDHRSITVKHHDLKACTVDAREIPDLVPVISVMAALAEGTTHIINAGRLRLKESDRLESTKKLINDLGGTAEDTEDSLIITGKKKLAGGTAETEKDHRIAMAAAVASCACESPVNVIDAQCVEKSYPSFWEAFDCLEAEEA